MKVAVIGGGPGGLYFSYLLKRDFPKSEITIYEKNDERATFGFGVVFSDRALEFLKDDDEDTYNFLTPRMQMWPDLKIVHRDEDLTIDGNGFASIERLRLLELLRERCQNQGIFIQYKCEVTSLNSFQDHDLIVGADGVNSFVRGSLSQKFGACEDYLSNRFAWYGTTKPFDCLSLTFRENEHGTFCAHHYRYTPDLSTFIVECDEATWNKAGFTHMDDDESRRYCEKVFAVDLDGNPLLSNKSIWRQFPLISNAKWSSENIVLIGDASRTVHFSIGSGTRVAMEDAIFLVRALKASAGNIRKGLKTYELERKPIADKLHDASIQSARWYEDMGNKKHMTPYQFAHDYMTRTGRVSDDRLRQLAPNFMKKYGGQRASTQKRC